jgi:lipopolysaccharide transport system permease protein
MARRELTDQHEGQMLGVLWPFFHPLILMTVYALVFGFVFKLKISHNVGQLPLDYTAYLLAGLVPWLAFQACLTKSCTAVSSQASLVKQVVFPLEVLPTRVAIACLTTEFVGLAYLVFYAAIKLHQVPLTYALVPLLVFIQFIAMIGTAYLLAALSVYFRDLKEIVTVATLIGLYLLPIFYLPNAVPAVFRKVLLLNPFSYMVWTYQDVFYYGRIAHPYAWYVFGFGSAFIYATGFRVFRRLKPTFGNVL